MADLQTWRGRISAHFRMQHLRGLPWQCMTPCSSYRQALFYPHSSVRSHKGWKTASSGWRSEWILIPGPMTIALRSRQSMSYRRGSAAFLWEGPDSLTPESIWSPLLSVASRVAVFSSSLQAHFSISVNVGVESALSVVCSQSPHTWRLGWIFCASVSWVSSSKTWRRSTFAELDLKLYGHCQSVCT